MKALVFGTILFDVYPDEVLIGGCSTNVASHCALLGAETTHLSRIGTDDLGQMAMRHFASLGVDTSFVTIDPEHATGRVDVSVNASGQPEYVLAIDTAYDYIHLDEGKIADIVAAGYDFIYFGTVDQRGPVSARTLRKLLDAGNFKHVFCDINLRENCYTRDCVEYSLRKASILKINDDELRDVPAILGMKIEDEESARVRALQSEYDIDLIILTKSADGATAYTASGNVVHRAGRKVVVQDAVGAGDAFSAAFILNYIATGDLEKSLDAGNYLGGYVASKKGAVPVSSEYPRNLVGLAAGAQ